MQISKIKNLKKSESASTKTMSSLESTASSGFASIFFIKNLSGTNYNAGRQASAVYHTFIGFYTCQSSILA